MKILQTILVASLLTITASASAALHSFEVNPTTGGQLPSNSVDKIATTFDSASERFTWDTTFNAAANSTGDDVDGFWLVVNNGPNPKTSNTNELAIMYGDLVTGVLSTYVYNGLNNDNSITTPGIHLQTNQMTTHSSGGFSFDIPTANINAWTDPSLPAGAVSEYTGISFAEKVGIWFHFTTGSEFTYTGNRISDYGFHGLQGYYDVQNLVTTNVSAPSAIALFGLAFAGLTLVRRKNS